MGQNDGLYQSLLSLAKKLSNPSDTKPMTNEEEKRILREAYKQQKEWMEATAHTCAYEDCETEIYGDSTYCPYHDEYLHPDPDD